MPATITAIPTQAPMPTLGVAAMPAPEAARRCQLEPLSESRHRVQFTASDELRKKLERAQDLMRHANADGDLAVGVERAVDLLLVELEKQRLGKTARPRPSGEERSRRSVTGSLCRPATDTGRISRATRRAVFERDGDRCTFVDADGHRCPSTTWLELDHVSPRARGGTSEVGNLRVRCRAHNLLHAEQTFGKEHVERKIREPRRPRQRGSVSNGSALAANSDSSALAASGLVNMGFRRAEVQCALDAVRRRHRPEELSTIPVHAILREALAVLT